MAKHPTKFVAPLTDSQRQRLEELQANDPSHRVRTRAHAVLLSARGFSINDIAHIYQVHRDTVRAWLDAWEDQGLEGLPDQPRSGKPPRLTPPEKEQVLAWLREQPHAPQTVLARIEKQLGKSISIDTLRRIAKAAGMSWKRLRKTVAQEPDPEEWQQAVEDLTFFQQLHQAGDIDLRYFDEAGFCLQPCVPYGWQVPGETVAIPSSGSERLNVLGFLNLDNELQPYCFQGPIDSAVVIACFDHFATQLTQETLVVMDCSSLHSSDAFFEKVPEWEEQGLYVYFLPPYSPELNRIEILWRFIKYLWLPLSAYVSFEALVEAVEEILRSVGKSYRINFSYAA